MDRSARPTALADAGALARLRSLGYVSGAVRRPSARPEDDPKRLLPLHTRFQRAADLAASNPAAAVNELRDLIRVRPDFASAYEAAGTLLIETGRPHEAVALLTAAKSRGLNHPALRERLGAALLASGDSRGAVSLLEGTSADDVGSLQARHTLALALIAAGDLTRARGPC